MFRFAHPLWLLALLLLPLLVLTHWRRERPATLQYSDLQLVHGLPRSARLRLRWLPLALRLVALAFLVLAVARPQSGRALEILRGKGIDTVIALDISGSMAALDFEPQNRLSAAKQVVDEFIAKRRYDRIGLVVFAREAFSQSPPTLDYAVLRRQLAEIELATDLRLDDGTAIGLGLAQAAAMLQESDAQSRVIILLTDGVNNAGQIDPLTAAQAAAALDVKVYTIGAARPGQVPIPVNDPWFGPTTQMIESEIDEETLRHIADETGGLYFRAKDTAGLQQIYEQIDQLEKSEVEVQVFVRYRELGAWLLLPALGLILLELLLRNTLFRTLP
ncbi:MAG: VWA domain-containing protein [Anaerolineae bacterium]|jgi:Ca-activated chloride channel family protein